MRKTFQIDELRESVALKRNYCQRMTAGIRPDTRLSGV